MKLYERRWENGDFFTIKGDENIYFVYAAEPWEDDSGIQYIHCLIANRFPNPYEPRWFNKKPKYTWDQLEEHFFDDEHNHQEFTQYKWSDFEEFKKDELYPYVRYEQVFENGPLDYLQKVDDAQKALHKLLWDAQKYIGFKREEENENEE